MSVRRWAAALCLAVATIAVPGVVAAHAELIASDPADGAVLPTVTPTIVLTFGGELDPDGSGFTVVAPGGAVVGHGELDLDVADRDVMRGDVAGNAIGPYEVRWTAVSIDGHVEEGTLRFSVGTDEAPNTALPTPIPTWPFGVLLVVVAVALAVDRRLSLALLAVAVVLAACVTESRPDTCDAERVTIDLTLTATDLSPSDPAACRDQSVTIVVDAQTDGVLHIHGYDEAVPATSVEAGQTVTLEFSASRSGQFPIELHATANPEGVVLGIFTVYEP